MRGIRTKAMLIGFTILLSGRSYANEEITVDLPGGATMEMVAIAPGTFTMGSPDSDTLAYSVTAPAFRVGPTIRGGEKPQHQVTISKGFYLGKYEMSV